MLIAMECARLHVGYLLTWTCRGSWLHGDHRGSVDDGTNLYGTPTLPPNRTRVDAIRSRTIAPAALLTTVQRDSVATAIRSYCAHRRWRLEAVKVRTNHAHCVVLLASSPPETVMRLLKAWSTRALRERGLLAANQPIWTRHGSTRWLWNEANVIAATRYVEEQQ